MYPHMLAKFGRGPSRKILGAVRRERFLTIDNPLNPPGVGWVKKM